MTDATPTTEETPVPLNKKGKPHLREISKARTRERLIEAGRRLFDQRGYIDATIRDIAREAGLSTGAIFGVFPEGKPALYQAITGHPVITPAEGARAMVILRALVLDIGDGPHDDVDIIMGLEHVKEAAAGLMHDVGIDQLDSETMPSPDDETLGAVYLTALERPL